MVDFLIIGGGQCAGYKVIFQLIKDRKMWSGVKKWNENVYFIPGEFSEDMRTDRSFKGNDGEVMTTINMCVWWTNLEHHHRRKLECRERYEEGKYEKFDYVDCINIDDVRMIPAGYMGLMGVPVSFIERWDPDEYDLIGIANSGGGGLDLFCPVIDGKIKYLRLLIKRRKKDG